MSKYMAVALLGLAALLAGCGSKDDAQSSAPVAPKKVVKVVKPVEPTDPLAGMAQAVPEDKKSNPVKVKYNLATKPQVGQRLDIELGLVFSSDSKGGTVTFAGMPGLQVEEHAERTLPPMKAGQGELQKLSVTPAQAGIYYVNVSVKNDVSAGGATYNFWIPMVVSSEAEVAKAAPVPAKKTAAAAH